MASTIDAHPLSPRHGHALGRVAAVAALGLAAVLPCRAQLTTYTGQQITNPTGTLLFTWHGSVPLINYQEAGLQVSCNAYDQGQACTKCCRPSGFSLGGYYFGGGVQQLVAITRADGGALSALEFQAGDYYNGCTTAGDGTIYLWALVTSGGNLVGSFDIDVHSGTYVGFTGVFDLVQVGAYVNSAARDQHSQTSPEAIAMDNMRYVASPCPAFAAPANVYACADGTNSFSVNALGAAPIAYQWQWQPLGGNSWQNVAEGFNAEPAPFAFTASGAQSASLMRTGALTPGSVALYRCVVSNDCSSITSPPAVMAVTPAPTIVEQPQDDPACSAPGYASFSVQVDPTPSDPGPFAYQWQSLSESNTWTNLTDSEDTTGTTTPYLTIVFDAPDARQYRCVITNGCGSTISRVASLSFGNGPTISVQPFDAETCPSGYAAFDVESAGNQPVSDQWRVESPPGSGQYLDLTSNATFTDPATGMTLYVQGADQGYMTVSDIVLAQHPDTIRFVGVISDGCGSVTSNPATLTVCVADYDCNGFVNGDDFDAFSVDFFYGNPAADVDGNGFVNGDDFDYFTAHFDAGC